MVRKGLSSYSMENLAVAAHWRSKELAKLLNLSTRQLQRDFKQLVSCSPQEWLDKRRIKVAQQMLLAGKPVKTVAFELGFKQVSHFCRKFKAKSNMTPSCFTSLHPNNDMISQCRF
jgi:AraC-like DNA-binding protein